MTAFFRVVRARSVESSSVALMPLNASLPRRLPDKT
jgi:hypothetical protein